MDVDRKAQGILNKISDSDLNRLKENAKKMGLCNSTALCNGDCKCSVCSNRKIDGTCFCQDFGHSYCQGVLGITPSHFVENIEEFRNYELPNYLLCRAMLRKLAKTAVNSENSNDYIVAIIAIIAWGGQTAHRQQGKWGPYIADNLNSIIQSLRNLWKDGLTEPIFNDLMSIRGLGISFVSKIIFFFNPRNNTLILDRVVSNNIEVYTKYYYNFYGTTYQNYILYNKFLELVAEKLGLAKPELTEILFFN